MIKQSIFIFLTALSAACAQLPRVEFQAYRDAVQAAQSAATPVIESYAARERASTLNQLKLQRNFATFGYFERFEPTDVTAASSLATTAGAEATNRAFSAIVHYNETLAALAENRNIDEARVQLRQLTSDLTGIAPQLAPAEQPIKLASDLLLQLFTPLIESGNRQEFRRIVLEGYPHVIELIDTLRDLTPAQYSRITAPLRERWLDEPANQAALAEQINGWHRVFADYVFLLNAMEARLSDLRDAVANPQSASLLARASAGAADLRVYAEGLRRSIADLRAPR